MPWRLEQLACASLFSDRGTTHNQIGDPRVFGCQKADPQHIRLIKLERISINVRLPNLKFGVTQQNFIETIRSIFHNGTEEANVTDHWESQLH